MSRSFKKVPCLKVKDESGFAKRQANLRVRRRTLEEVQSGGWYKKLYEHWDICDLCTVYWPGRLHWGKAVQPETLRKARSK